MASRYMNGSLPQFAPGNCDLFYVCNKFRLKPGSLSEDGRWGGYMNGESTLPEMRTEKKHRNIDFNICDDVLSVLSHLQNLIADSQ